MEREVIELDGAMGGGQVLRSGLSLSMVTGRALRITNIRGRRSRPGLLRQHLTAVLASAEVCGAQMEGAQLRSQNLYFEPGPIRGGDFRFAIGTAGSCTLVLQTLLPALLQAPEPSRVLISGGTHNPLAPPFEFLERAWLPLLRRMGAKVELQLLRHGFVPAGGGELEAFIQPSILQVMELNERGAVLGSEARVLIGGIDESVAERELSRIGLRLDIPRESCLTERVDSAASPGNVLLLEYRCEQVTEVFSAFGQVNLRAEAVADVAANATRHWLSSGAAVGEHLADQLLLPMALAGGGSFTTPGMTEHLHSNIRVIEAFMPLRIACATTADGVVQVECRA
ncbi:RNA 3'-terminal phosphate cyclase [Pseudomonas gingeri]|uniref:RNA 3'-terminal phosphate cyclase n=2 Tax=Pseudomonas gingeri TaxID=117681 RepID=A0A7Y7YBC9_9PSED|nr:RNA 3'-terminal phosphate cyclase [Pseudomonas gingeri]NWB25519.1 RNA 3'-terminal phosphate cyclase [Pseudomonas gingeri]NWC33233.1 RNA 3'-terminal phosphate cyclase [Pseudomonas gingeri]NWD08298.1 RNA 3'-terminal phosphate cyclase [Pseudomonas gingeri]NWD47913.1 RNA 3'-terminal phosphate cyclase [Pseudomonas gingeri]NWE33308.1 RNA 3'-terminal phosphate cyclase [Pseudomonas gingeri]